MDSATCQVAKKTKILILGAGPAGTSSAIKLSQAGFAVIIIDSAPSHRFRPGESCHPGIETLLRLLDVWEDMASTKPIRYGSTCVNIEGHESVSFFNEDEKWQGFQFPRECFDSILLRKAISLGVEFIPSTKTLGMHKKANILSSIVINRGEFKFDFLIDATGSKSLSSRKLGLQREFFSKRIVSNYTRLYSEERIPDKLNSYFEITDDYWGYISLIKPNTYSVTYSSCNNFTSNKTSFLAKHFTKPYSQIVSKGYDTSWSITHNNEYENLYLVGDALMTFDPTSSKGILKSIMNGIYVAFVLNHIQTKRIVPSLGAELYRNWATNFFEKELSRIKQLLPQIMVKHVFT